MRENLKRFNMKCLNELKPIMKPYYWGEGTYSNFWDELESLLRSGVKIGEWVKKPKDDIVLGDVWECPIGEFYHKHTVHKFTYLYAEYNPKQELVIDLHGHEEPFHGGKQVKKGREWYIFPNGAIRFCNKDELHKLVNDYEEPIYVLSVNVMSNAQH